MSKYYGSGNLGASTSIIEVEADSLNEAIDEIYDNIEHPSICHQCSSEVELGDIHSIVVMDEDYKEVYNDSFIDEILRKNKELAEIISIADIINIESMSKELQEIVEQIKEKMLK